MNLNRTGKTFSLVAFVVAMGAGLVLGISGCNRDKGDGSASNSGSSSGAKYAFVTNNASEFWKIASAGVHKYEKEAGVTVDIKMPPNGKVEEQNQIIEDLVSQGYSGIGVSVIAPDDQIAVINKAASKTNVICFDSDCAKSNRLVYIGTNNVDAGKALGEQIVKLLPSGGKMAVFVGTFSADNAAQRLQGIQEVIKGHNIDIVAQKEDQTDRNKARTNVEDVINGYSDLNLICGLWSYNGPAIAKAIDASGKKGKVLAAVFDDEDGTLEGIQSGTINCTVVQKPFDEGYITSKTLNELTSKGKSILPTPPVIPTGVRVIDKSNIADYNKDVAEMKKAG